MAEATERRPPLGDGELLALLEVIRVAALLPELRSDADPALAYVLGQIYVLAEGALAKHRVKRDGERRHLGEP